MIASDGGTLPRSAHVAVALTWRCLWMACWSIAQAFEHDGKRDASGTEVSAGAQERAMPEPQPHQATRAVGVSVVPPLAHIAYRAEDAHRANVYPRSNLLGQHVCMFTHVYGFFTYLHMYAISHVSLMTRQRWRIFLSSIFGRPRSFDMRIMSWVGRRAAPASTRHGHPEGTGSVCTAVGSVEPDGCTNDEYTSSSSYRYSTNHDGMSPLAISLRWRGTCANVSDYIASVYGGLTHTNTKRRRRACHRCTTVYECWIAPYSLSRSVLQPTLYF